MRKPTARLPLLPAALALFFLLLMLAGVWLDEFTPIMEKAVTICLDCMGIG